MLSLSNTTMWHLPGSTRGFFVCCFQLTEQLERPKEEVTCFNFLVREQSHVKSYQAAQKHTSQLSWAEQQMFQRTEFSEWSFGTLPCARIRMPPLSHSWWKKKKKNLRNWELLALHQNSHLVYPMVVPVRAHLLKRFFLQVWNMSWGCVKI